MVSINTDYVRFTASTAKLIDIHSRSQGLDVEYQKLISETLMLRLFYELDLCVEGVILKLIRGAKYLDGSSPALLVPAFKSQDAARQYILRRQGKYYLEWTTLKKVKKNLAGILDSSDHFLATRTLFDGTYDEMRKVRNNIAHSTASTRANFSIVVRKVYMTTSGISPAKFLLSKKAAITGYGGSDVIIAQYIKWSRVFVKTLTRA